MMNKQPKRHWLLLIFCPIVIFLLVTWFVELLWNLILPDVLGVKPILYWQAMGILVLSKMLFGGFGGRWGKGMKRHLDRKTQGMTAEEKEKFKELWKQKCLTQFCKKNED